MTLTQQVYAQATLMAPEQEPRQQELLRLLCESVTSALTLRLRDNLTPEDCRADFVAAASLYALAALGTAADGENPEQFQVGDVTIRCRSADTASRCLFKQAELIIAPYLKQSFCFQGV